MDLHEGLDGYAVQQLHFAALAGAFCMMRRRAREAHHVTL
jgi:hypothetical protein